MRRHAGIVVAALLVAAAVTASWALSAPPSQGLGLSTYRSGPDGGKALASAYRAAGRQVSQLRLPFTPARLASLPPGTTLFVLAPPLAWRADEIHAVAGWVDAGGHVVLAGSPDGQRSGAGTPDAELAPGVAAASAGTGPLVPAGAAPEAAGWHSLPPARASFRLPAGAQAVARGPGGAGVAALSRGAGRVVALSDPDMVTARRLRQGDGAAFALALAPGPVAFDEYHHGFQDSETSGFEQRFDLVELQLLVAVLVVFLARGRRRAPPSTESEDQPFSRAAFADALAESLRAADGRDAALDLLRVDLRRLLRSRTLAPPDAGDDELARRAQAAGLDVRQALLDPAPTEAAFVTRARQVAESIGRLR